MIPAEIVYWVAAAGSVSILIYRLSTRAISPAKLFYLDFPVMSVRFQNSFDGLIDQLVSVTKKDLVVSGGGGGFKYGVGDLLRLLEISYEPFGDRLNEIQTSRTFERPVAIYLAYRDSFPLASLLGLSSSQNLIAGGLGPDLVILSHPELKVVLRFPVSSSRDKYVVSFSFAEFLSIPHERTSPDSLFQVVF